MRIWPLILTMALVGCSSNPKPYFSSNSENKNKCLAAGGTPRAVDWTSFVCMKPAKDAGKACLDNSECEGLCRFPELVDSRPAAEIKRMVEEEEAILPVEVLPTGKPGVGKCTAEKSITGKVTNCAGLYLENGVIRMADCFH